MRRRKTPSRFFLGPCALALVLLAPIALGGCRAGVQGWWSGTIGDEPAQLRIEEIGSRLEGEVCSADACTPILEGEIVDRSVSLTYGCDDCAFPLTSLEVLLEGSNLSGEADALTCDCGDEADCDCREPATFIHCNGPCH